MKTKIQIFTLILLISISAFSQQFKYNVVFDLDWTLFYQIQPSGITRIERNETESENLILFNDKEANTSLYYRLTPYTIESLVKLHQNQNINISFMSGGDKERNEFLVNWIYNHKELKHYRPFKILSLQDLYKTTSSETQNTEALKFTDKYKKRLTPYFTPLQYTVLIDDSNGFSFPGEERNMIWLGKTYEYYSEYSNIEKSINKKYLPQCLEEWKREREKIKIAVDRVLDAIQKSPQDILFYLSRTSEIQLKDRCH